MSENKDDPMPRRRRKILRHQREKTPEPTAKSGIKIKYSDEESSSAAEHSTEKVEIKLIEQEASIKSMQQEIPMKPVQQEIPTKPITVRKSAHRSKILSRRDKAVGTAAIRSQSTPRNDTSTLQPEVLPILRQPKPRSLSTPSIAWIVDKISTFSQASWHKETPPDYLPVTPQVKSDTKNVPSTGTIQPTQEDDNRKLTQLELNLKKFEQERKYFEMEKEKFEKEKLEMRKIRYQRLEDFERRRMEKEKKSKEIVEENNHEKLYKICSLLERKSGTSSASPLLGEDGKVKKDTQSKNDRVNSEMSKREPAEIVPKSKVKNLHAEVKHTGKTSPKIRKSSHSTQDDLSDDYESSTALSSSSRDGDFDDIDDEFIKQEISKSVPLHLLEEPPAPVNVENVKKPSILSKIPLIGRFWGKKIDKPVTSIQKKKEKFESGKNLSFAKEAWMVWRELINSHQEEWAETKLVRNKCITNLIILAIFCGMGGIFFRFIEGAFENFYKCGVRRVKRDFVDHLWTSSHNLREDDWKTLARNKLRIFEEELHSAHEAGMTSYSGMKSWSFINGVNYCMTVVTTIGYGHISPSTNTGRAITIVYAIFGIPIFLILLADFGKLFTRGIKFLWAYVRRLYYTGSCRRVRKTTHVEEVLRGMEMAYDFATFRKTSLVQKDEGDAEQPPEPKTADTVITNPDSLVTTIPEDVEEIVIDDEFNLPISLALSILLLYIFCGAAVYSIWEEWSFFESCYFVFISMSTIGFGDYVPNHPIYMMTSIIYLVFGLALTSMCINVVQLKLSDSFRQASAKIGSTIGLPIAEDEEEEEGHSPEGEESTKIDVNKTDSSVENNNAKNESIVEPPPPPLLPKKSQLLAAEQEVKNKSKSSKKK